MRPFTALVSKINYVAIFITNAVSYTALCAQVSEINAEQHDQQQSQRTSRTMPSKKFSGPQILVATEVQDGPGTDDFESVAKRAYDLPGTQALHARSTTFHRPNSQYRYFDRWPAMRCSTWCSWAALTR